MQINRMQHKQHDFRKKKLKQKVCFDFPYKLYLGLFLFQEEFSELPSQLYIGLRVKNSLPLSDFNQI